MKIKNIHRGLPLADPESRFNFSTVDTGVKLTFRDWQNYEHIIIFTDAEYFTYTNYSPYPEIAEECFVEIQDSEQLKKLSIDGLVVPYENYKHYLISSNEDEWCEVIATGIEFGEQ